MRTSTIARAGAAVVAVVGLHVALITSTWAQELPVGNQIVVPQPAPKPAPSSNNVVVNVTPPAPDPAATRAMYGYVIATTESDHAAVPVTWASDLLKGANIWTRTPTDHFDQPIVAGMRNSARNAALGLFLLGILWTGLQLSVGSALGTTSYQQVLPMVVAGFLLAWYADSIAHRAIDLNNWLCTMLAAPSLVDFTGTSLTLPEPPDLTAPGIVKVAASFTSGVLTSLLYAIVLLILELKMIFREAVLIVGDVVMPISGALWAFGITRGWGVQLFRWFFGWLYGQPLVVVCLALSSSLLTLFNISDGPGQVLVKVAILFLALKLVSFLSGASLGGGGAFGLAGLLFLLRRAQSLSRRGAASGGGTTSTPQQPNTPAVQSGQANGTGNGTAATGRPWRPAMGTA